MFKIKNFGEKTLSWWFSQIDKIDLSPSFQRKGKIWSVSEKQLLIDSILNDYDIPKFYVSDNTYGVSLKNEKKKTYSVIDGRQRFESIFDFFNNKLDLSKDFLHFANPNLELAGLNYSALKIRYPEIARQFEDYELYVMKVITDEDGKVNDMFIRLNKSSKSLVGAEIRNASTSPVAKIIRKLSSHLFFKTSIRFSVKRSQEFNAVAKMLLVEAHGRFVDMKKTNLDELVNGQLEEEAQLDLNEVQKHVDTILTRMSEVFKPLDPLLSSQGPLILYYWFIKNNKSDSNKVLRSFLENFSHRRKENTEVAKVNPGKADSELQSYQSFSRSPNDGNNMARCYEILIKRYEKFNPK